MKSKGRESQEAGITNLLEYIYVNHGLNHRFKAKPVYAWMKKNYINHSILSYLCGAKVLDNPERGVYRMLKFSENLTPYVMKHIREYNKNLRVSKLSGHVGADGHKGQEQQGVSQSAKPVFVSSVITESKAIEFLKKLGYKILKPKTEFEEV